MTAEDNTFDFHVRDRLLEECKKMDYKIHHEPEENKLMMDMITYCSQGNRDEAILNLKATKEFQDRCRLVCSRLNFPPALPLGFFVEHTVNYFLYNFWKKSFIEIKVAVEKQEAPRRVSYHEIIMRDYQHFFNEQNFPNFAAFQNQLNHVSQNILSAAENLNNTLKALRRQSEG